jgi:circadian clock protein KaiC
MTNLTGSGFGLEQIEVAVSSLIDIWLLLRDIELQGERNRVLYVLKSRGMVYSNQIREFVFTHYGVDFLDVYVGPEGVLTGTSRLVQEAKKKTAALARQQDIERRQRDLDRQRATLEAQIAALRSGYESEQDELRRLIAEGRQRELTLAAERRRRAQPAEPTRRSRVRTIPRRGGDRSPGRAWRRARQPQARR